ncbi:M55 family metallopeptidase [Brevibacillus agri]|uniref:M55 family metallopeptidase n=1 Tax=Brevibacillus agri TaxID=51101 RepID=UPI002E24359B
MLTLRQAGERRESRKRRKRRERRQRASCRPVRSRRPLPFLIARPAKAAQKINSHIKTVPVSEGIGNAAISIHPNVAQKNIKEQVSAVLADDLSKYRVALPETFHVEIAFREHYLAYRGSFYPGAKQTGAKTVEYESNDYMDVLRFLFFVL